VRRGNESDDELENGTAPSATRPDQSFEDEVEESPRDAPGSGRRRSRIPSAPASELAARLHNVVIESDDVADSSSPLARVAKRKSVGPSAPARSTREATRGSSLRRVTRPEEDDELSPNRPRDADPESEAAEEIGAAEAAKTIGRKRPRRSVSRQSPDIGSEQPQAEDEPRPADEEDEPPPKKRRGRPSKSPVTQKQPARAKAAAAKAKTTRRTSQEVIKRATKTKNTVKSPKPAPKQRRRRRSAAEGNDEVAEDGDDDNAAIEITVQRFVNLKKRGGADDGEDPLHSEIPFANRSGESTVDVFAQVCEEVINNTMGQFHELLSSSAADAAKKKEFRIKMRAIEAYKEELNSRLLQHVSTHSVIDTRAKVKDADLQNRLSISITGTR
jgi:hypothetical protein